MEKYTNAKYTVEIIVDDNPVTGKKVVKGGWNSINFWLSDTKPELRSVSVNTPEIRHDFLRLVDKLKKLERGLAVVMTMSERNYKAAVQLAHDSVDYGVKTLQSNDYDFDYMKENFARKINAYFKVMDFRFPSKNSGLISKVRRFQAERDELEAKSKLRELIKSFQKMSLEAKIPIELAA
jgi:hypothetical protein